ncbi:Retrovirus-related Pol polyprotein from transposon RE1 [Vitis vinifera]|uniref:Retrovirus-related Pol polyprotein from transposon RE1 n=1 Tax=Vitis vinifera TaxID=29760 RepID=A0A438DZC9_VITVI|nr:Retrovirus-related Pol polyprotein from transposon RE1 [Vitis vinifera]
MVTSRPEAVHFGSASTTDGIILPIAGHKLNGQNFIQWVQFVQIFICGKGENFMYYGATKEIWDVARETYSNIDNTSAIFEIKRILQDLRQGDSTVTEYFNILTRYWQQLDIYEELVWKCPEDGLLYKKVIEKERIYKFLLGLNKNLDEVCGRVLSIKPLPSVREVFFEIRREESRQKVMLGTQNSSKNLENSALVARGTQSNNNNHQTKKNRPWCDHCRKPGHTKETCWHLHGKPADWKPSRPQQNKEGRGYTVCSRRRHIWHYLKSGKSHYMDSGLRSFRSHDWESHGSIIISKDITLHSLLYVPKLDCNLLSISRLTQDLNCVTKFLPHVCEFQALNSGKRIGNAEQNGVAERKNRHLMEVARSLMIASNVPKQLWGEAVFTSTYLINRMPSRILQFKTLCQILLAAYPSARIISSIPVKVFGCIAFVHIHKSQHSKLDPTATKCIFLGLEKPPQKEPEDNTPPEQNQELDQDPSNPNSQLGNTIYDIDSSNDLDDLDQPIALRKDDRIPSNIQEALQQPEWKTVIQEEIQALEKNGTWEISEFLKGKRPVGYKELEEEVYMKIPPSMETPENSGKVCKLRKSLYGLKQSPRAWFHRLTGVVKKHGFVQCQADHTLFMKHSKEGEMTLFIVYVDDIIITRDDEEGIGNLKKLLAREFEIKDLGQLRYFLGMEVGRTKEGIVVTQRKYVLDLLQETGMLGCKPVDTPMDPVGKIDKDNDSHPTDRDRYQRLVRKLIYLTHTRPDIGFAVSMSPGRGLHFKKTSSREVEVFTDADWAGSLTDRRSTTGYCSYVWGNLVTWRSKKQSVVARSSAEAEFRAMAHGICEGMWLQRILKELGIISNSTMTVLCDNKATISIAKNPVQHDRTKHVEIDRHFIKEKLEGGTIKLMYIPSSRQTTDILTKALPKATYENMKSKLGMLDIYYPT